jgi:hypothetical protein
MANCSRPRPKSMPSGWPMTIETNSSSHLCHFKWWFHYKNHTWVIVSISLSNVWRFCLPIVIGVLKKRGPIWRMVKFMVPLVKTIWILFLRWKNIIIVQGTFFSLLEPLVWF